VSEITVADFMEVEDQIVAQLQAKLPAGFKVLSADDLAGLTEATQPAPAVHVISNWYSVSETSSNGRVAVIRPSWLVVVVVKHEGAREKASREAKQRAKPHIGAVLDALMGFRPFDRPGTPGLNLATPPKPLPRPPFFYFPILFTVEMPVSSRSNT
jgi:hypothetical protein